MKTRRSVVLALILPLFFVWTFLSIQVFAQTRVSKPSSSNKLFKTGKGDFGIWYDESKWRKLEESPDAKPKVKFQLIGEDAYVTVIAENVEVLTSSMRQKALINLQKGIKDAKVILEEKRLMNDREILCLKMDGTFNQIPVIVYGYWYSGKEGTIQVITSTAKNLFEKYEQEFNNFLNGLVISPSSSVSSASLAEKKQTAGDQSKDREVEVTDRKVGEITRIVQKKSEGLKEPQGVRITLEEGEFIIKDLNIVKEHGLPTLKGSIINNTPKDWINVTFNAFLYDQAGNKLKVGILKKEEVELRFYGIKRGEEKQVRSGYGETLFDLKDPVSRIEVKFKEGEYPAKYNFAMTKPQVNKELVFDDKFLRIVFAVSKKQITFNLRNKTDNPIKIDWNQVSYVDVLGKSHKVMHAGVKYTSRNEPQSPTIIPPTAQLEDMVFPTDYVYFASGRYGGWTDIPLFPEAPAAKHFKDQLFSVFMPLDINGTIKNYPFTFKIIDVEM